VWRLSSRAMSERELDVVVYGATGYTGRLVVDYLARSGPVDLRWAVAGRNAARLSDVAHGTKGARAEPPRIIIASAEDAPSLREMARRARVVLTTVGPYAKYGLPLVEACVAEGTDYVDLTGEPGFVQEVMTKLDGAAREGKVRLVSCCGFDSIPHDVGVLHAVRALRPHAPIASALTVRGYIRATGSFSGGTWHSALEAMAAGEKGRAAREPKREPSGRVIRKLDLGPHHEPLVRSWAVPTPMLDPWIVRRTARALEEYGPQFANGHYICTGNLAKTAAVIGGGAAFFGLARFAPTRNLLARVKAPGDGPTPEKRERSRFAITFIAEAAGKRVVTRVSGGDPGYGETAKMIAEAALSLARDRDLLPPRYGALTPAHALGERLLVRLPAAGIPFEILEAP
jgi:short subunit dehydrogenase-like uncharacterized protein